MILGLISLALIITGLVVLASLWGWLGLLGGCLALYWATRKI